MGLVAECIWQWLSAYCVIVCASYSIISITSDRTKSSRKFTEDCKIAGENEGFVCKKISDLSSHF